jgi:hypothetical protein
MGMRTSRLRPVLLPVLLLAILPIAARAQFYSKTGTVDMASGTNVLLYSDWGAVAAMEANERLSNWYPVSPDDESLPRPNWAPSHAPVIAATKKQKPRSADGGAASYPVQIFKFSGWASMSLPQSTTCRREPVAQELFAETDRKAKAATVTPLGEGHACFVKAGGPALTASLTGAEAQDGAFALPSCCAGQPFFLCYSLVSTAFATWCH